MTVCLLVRHAAHDLLGRVLVGRKEGVPLSDIGRQQAALLARGLTGAGITHIETSPRQRALETARIIGEAICLPVRVVPALDEIDFGLWTGRTFAELEGDPAWRRWNSARGAACPPMGEDMQNAQSRIVAHLRAARITGSNARIVMVTHAEIIRAAALSLMSLPLDAWQKIDVPPASVTRIEMRAKRHALVSTAWQAAS